MKRALVIDICCILHAPVHKPLMLLYLAHKAGAEVICRSYLGRSTTKKLLRKVRLLSLFDDFLWNEHPAPDYAYELLGPDDWLFGQVGRDLTRALDYTA